MIYSMPYIAFVVFYGVLAAWWHHAGGEERQKTYIKVLCAAAFLFFIGFRGFICYDWSNYYPHFQFLPDLEHFSLDYYQDVPWEPGFTLLSAVCKTLTGNYLTLQFACCVIDLWLLWRFLSRYVGNIPLGFMVFLAMGGLTSSIDLLRNTISILIFLNALPFLSQRRPWPYFSLCLLAMSFHLSAIIYLPLYFILHRRYDTRFLLLLFIAANVIFLFHIPIVKETALFVAGLVMPSTKLWINIYLSIDEGMGTFLSIGYLERLLTGFLLFVYIDKLRARREGGEIFVNSLVLYLVLFLSLSEYRTIAVRITTLFCFTYWVIWPDLLHCIRHKGNKWLFLAFIGIYSALKTQGNFHTAITDYYNVLFQQKSYSERLMHFRKHVDDE